MSNSHPSHPSQQSPKQYMWNATIVGLSVSQSFKSPFNQISIVAQVTLVNFVFLVTPVTLVTHSPQQPQQQLLSWFNNFTDFSTGIATSSFPHHVCKTLSDESSSTGKLRILGRQSDVTNLQRLSLFNKFVSTNHFVESTKNWKIKKF